MLNNIQALRALAAIMVVFDHWADLNGGAWQKIGLLGSTGVDLFFVLSGFVMTYSTARKTMSPKYFALNRIVRIVPLYWAGTLVLFVCAFFAPSLFRSTEAEIGPLAKSLFFIPYMKGSGLVQPMLFPGWTLNYEMFFYALFSISLAIRHRAAQHVVLLSTLVILVLGGLFFRPTGIIVSFYTAPILLEFAYGIVLAIFFPALQKLIPSRRAAWLLLIAGIALLWSFQPLWPEIDRGFRIGPWAFLVVFATLVLETRGAVVRSRSMLLLGAASYALYLVHPFIVVGLFKLSARLVIRSDWGIALSGLVIVAVTTGVGVLLHLMFERPLDRRLRSWMSAPSNRANASDSLALWPWRRR